MTRDEFLHQIGIDSKAFADNRSPYLFAVKMPVGSYTETKSALEALRESGFRFPTGFDGHVALNSKSEFEAGDSVKRQFYLVDKSFDVLSSNDDYGVKVISYADVLEIVNEEDAAYEMSSSIDEVLKMIREAGGGVS